MTNSFSPGARRTITGVSHDAPRSTRICRVESLEKRGFWLWTDSLLPVRPLQNSFTTPSVKGNRYGNETVDLFVLYPPYNVRHVWMHGSFFQRSAYCNR